MMKKQKMKENFEDNHEVLKKGLKKEKRKKILSEMGAFLVLAVIIGSLIFGTWYWYNHVYDSTKSRKKNDAIASDTSSYTLISYKTEKDLQEFSNYLVEFYNNEIHKVMDKSTKTLFEGKLEFTAIYEGVDHQLYVILEENVETENIIDIYCFTDGSFKEIKSLNDSGIFYQPVLYNELLVGFAGTYDTIIKEEAKDYLYILGKEESFIIKDYVLEGKNKTKSIYTIDNLDTIVVSQYKNNKKYYGVYDMKNSRIVLPCDYDMLYEINDSTYIATYNGKVGILDKNGKKLVNFLYDFIEGHDSYYIVGKGNKMAIMNTDYEIKTGFDFEYQGVKYSYTNPNAFYSLKVNDNILLTVNYDTSYNYLANYTYVIKPDYTIDKIEAKYFYYGDVLYSYSDKTNFYTIYDENMNKKYELDFSKYHFENIVLLTRINEVTLGAKLDETIYFDYETGEELQNIKEPQDKEVTLGNLKLQYHGSKDVSVIVNDKEQFKYKQEYLEEKEIVQKDENYYFNLGSVYYALIKSE